MAFGLLETNTARRLLTAAATAGLDLASALEGDDDHLRRTEVAQPALLMVECTLQAAIPDETPIAAVAGHSVGEYAACVAAGALEPETAMRLVIARGRAMAAMREGTMCAFIGLDADVVSAICEDVQRETGEVVVVANLNAPGQVVISGTVAGVNAATQAATQKGLRRAVPLNVSGAFHSPLMADAATDFAADLDNADIRDPRVPVVCNVDATAVDTADALRDRLRRQLTSPVRWVDCVATLVARGADALVEVGPGTVLSGLARRIAPGVTTAGVSRLEDARRLGVAGDPG
jgi:[acyl-carrier-protein] S-malonyltransferase